MAHSQVTQFSRKVDSCDRGSAHTKHPKVTPEKRTIFAVYLLTKSEYKTLKSIVNSSERSEGSQAENRGLKTMKQTWRLNKAV